jgi:hypothetical protein
MDTLHRALDSLSEKARDLLEQLAVEYPVVAHCLSPGPDDRSSDARGRESFDSDDLLALGAEDGGNVSFVRMARLGSRLDDDRGSNRAISDNDSSDDESSLMGAPAADGHRSSLLMRGSVMYYQPSYAHEMDVVRARPDMVNEEEEEDDIGEPPTRTQRSEADSIIFISDPQPSKKAAVSPLADALTADVPDARYVA